MPIYEYQCKKCGYIFEEITTKMEPPKISTVCPNCAEKNQEGIAKKIISGGTVFTVHGFNSSNGYAGNMR